MLIKKVIIQNYKSYKEETVEDFSPSLNVIVGGNGCGKSNFLSAIQCVLSPESYLWRPDEKLPHINNEETMDSSATITIVFDNTSRRIPIPKDEVSFKRILNCQKDLFYVDQKPYTKQDMLNLLESIGLSRSNPYNIVKQGKVSELAMATDNQRYNLLLDIAGAKIYDEKRQESLRILNEANDKKVKICEYIENINERLKQLESEKRELVSFNQKSSNKRKIEYIIYKKDHNNCSNKINELGSEKNKLLKNASDTDSNIKNLECEVESITSKLKKSTDERSNISKQCDEYLNDLKDMTKSKSFLELELHDLKSTLLIDTKNKEKYEDQISSINSEILEKEEELKLLKSQLTSHKNLESGIKLKFQSMTETMSASQDTQYECSIDSSRRKSTLDQINNIKSRKEAFQARLNELKDKINKSNLLVDQLKKKRSQLIEEMRQLWIKDSTAAKSIQDLKQQLLNMENKYNLMVPRDIRSGLHSLKNISNQDSTGIFGPMLDNIESDPRFYTAIDVVAGSRLFNVLVENSDIATKILKKLKTDKLDGQLTLMPLNQLHHKSRDPPKIEDAIPLISKIKFDSRFEKAFKMIFGGTMLCRNKEVALKVSKEFDLDGVTLDGDQILHKGCIIGGHYDQKLKISESYMNIKSTRNEIDVKSNELRQINDQLSNINNEINQISICLQTEELGLNDLKRQHETLSKDVADMEAELNLLEDELSKSNFSQQSSKDTNALETLTISDQQIEPSLTNLSISELEQELKNAILNSSKITSKINRIESLFKNNLYIVRNELRQKLSELSSSATTTKIEAKSAELQSIESRFEEISEKLSESRKEMDRLKSEIILMESQLSEKQDLLNNLKIDQKKIMSDLENITNKSSLLNKKLKEAEEKMESLNVIQDEELSELNLKSLKWLWKAYNQYENELKNDAVNKKAAEEFLTLSNDRERVEKEYQELESSLQAINNLIDKLDKRKKETVMFSFKQASFHFSSIFSELFPEAKAHLVLRKGPTQNLAKNMDSEDITAYSELAIKVSFNSENEDYMEINQLSGGQKSLVTLALIFTFQRCDPVPFYLFDEVDQALDPQHRQILCQMLNKLSETKGQFFVTTFRPEILNYDPKCFQVTFGNRISRISPITIDEAKSIVQDEP